MKLLFPRCAKCPKPCCKKETVFLLPGEVAAIERETGKSAQEFATAKEGFFLTKKAPCPFFKAEKCSISWIKPLVCTTFPVCFKSTAGKAAFAVAGGCPAAKNLTAQYVQLAKNELLKMPDGLKKELAKAESGFKITGLKK